MLKTKLSTAILLVAVLSMLLAPAVYAAQTSGSFTAAGSKPTIDSIGVFSDATCLVPVTNVAGMSPLTEYWAKVIVTSKSKLSYLATVQATIYYDSSGGHGAPVGGGDTQKLAIFTWHADGVPSTWTKDSGGPPTSWTIETADCRAPTDFTLKTGEWKFAFKPGRVATQSTGIADWDAQGLATNKKPQTSDPLNYNAMAMNFYGEVLVSGTVDWGEVALGLKFTDLGTPPLGNPQVIGNVNYIANGNYNENIKSSATWTGGIETVTLDETPQPMVHPLPMASSPSRLMIPPCMSVQLLSKTPSLLP